MRITPDSRARGWPVLCWVLSLALGGCGEAGNDRASDLAPFQWRVSSALIEPRAGNGEVGLKDPSVVRHAGRWHVFLTVRSSDRPPHIQYLSFDDWERAADAERRALPLGDSALSTPQVFFYEPHARWYLVHQSFEPGGAGTLRAVYSTTTTLGDPDSWSPSRPLIAVQGEGSERWLDFWVICDERRAHLFFTSMDGRILRSETTHARFPSGWGTPTVALDEGAYEASHTYRLLGSERYLTIVEARSRGRRHQRAYLADSLDGGWEALAASWDAPFAGFENLRFSGAAWTESISHGELIRSGADERLLVDPARLRFVFQGAKDSERKGRPYTEVPWRIGMLESQP